ncbi:hypothetical protein ACNOYE_30945 [Nannocystaceae bacterium ST9]
MAASTLADAPDNAIAVVYATLDTCIAASTATLTKMQKRMDEVADKAKDIALLQIAKAAGG